MKSYYLIIGRSSFDKNYLIPVWTQNFEVVRYTKRYYPNAIVYMYECDGEVAFYDTIKKDFPELYADPLEFTNDECQLYYSWDNSVAVPLTESEFDDAIMCSDIEMMSCEELLTTTFELFQIAPYLLKIDLTELIRVILKACHDFYINYPEQKVIDPIILYHNKTMNIGDDDDDDT